MTIDDLLEVIKFYSEDDKTMIRKAYEYAKEMHGAQTRQSGEPYIIHPLNVAYILAIMYADTDTICAGLLHDTLEDTKATKEEIAFLFNPDVANLVDGVTKLSKLDFLTADEANCANIKRLISSITTDVRIILIKLADRLHNMRTLQYKSKFKQEENSLETMEIFAPIAYKIGAYQMKNELEDLSFMYLKPDTYKEIEEKRRKIEIDSNECLQEMLFKIKQLLDDKGIPNEIKLRIKNIYGIYKQRQTNGINRLSDIHDLFALKIIVDEVDQCYRTLGLVHSLYRPINSKFKDYIAGPKTNLYQSLHTTVFGPEDRLVQAQIRTPYMDKIASFGIATYWYLMQGNARDAMQAELRDHFQFMESLTDIIVMFSDGREFVRQAKSELFSDKVYVYTTRGETIELPKNSTPIDFAYKIHTDVGNTMVAAQVNGEYVPLDYRLQNKDRVRIITDESSLGPREEWLQIAQTSHARRRIREFSKK